MKLTEVELSQYSYNTLDDLGLTSLFQTKGQILIDDLGLSKFKHLFVQKVMGIAVPIYIITLNSKYPNIELSASRVKKLKFAWLGKAKKKGVHTYVAPIKLTPPLYLDSAMIHMSSGSLVFIRDIAGEYLRQPKMFAYTDYKMNKKVDSL